VVIRLAQKASLTFLKKVFSCNKWNPFFRISRKINEYQPVKLIIMETKKNEIQVAFKDFAYQNGMYINPTNYHTHYGSLSSAIKALKILQTLIGGEMIKGQRILRTHTTEYTIECNGGGCTIHERVRNEFIVARVKAEMGIF
jgi:hypothetical protein